MSFMEIYNENIKDLIGNSEEDSNNLDVREDPIKGVYIVGISEKECKNTDELMELLQQGNYNWTTEATDAN